MSYKNVTLVKIEPVIHLVAALAKMKLTGKLTIRVDMKETDVVTKVMKEPTDINTLKFLHALEEYGAHVSCWAVPRELAKTPEGLSARKEIRRTFNLLSKHYLDCFHPGKEKLWVTKPWLSGDLKTDKQAFDFTVSELLKYGLELCYRENTVFSLMFKDLLPVLVTLYWELIPAGGQQIVHESPDYEWLKPLLMPTKIELLAVTKCKDVPQGMLQSTHELMHGSIFR